MSVTIPRKYFKGRDDNAIWPVYIIAAPENVPELDGYVMKSMQDFTNITNNSIIFLQGNEWNRKQKVYLYMFEKEAKTPGHPSKRYRYTEEEVIRLYGNALSPTFEERLEKRKKTIEKGPGKLLRASYADFTVKDGKQIKNGWFVAPDANPKWIYPLNYDPLRDLGKHNRDAKGFSILEEYTLPDIAILREHKDQLKRLLSNLDYIRSLKVDPEFGYQEYVYDKKGQIIHASSLAEALAFHAYEQIPEEIRTNSQSYRGKLTEKPEGEQIRLKLMRISAKMEKLCAETVQKYQSEKLSAIASEIKDLIGIDIQQNLPQQKELPKKGIKKSRPVENTDAND